MTKSEFIAELEKCTPFYLKIDTGSSFEVKIKFKDISMFVIITWPDIYSMQYGLTDQKDIYKWGSTNYSSLEEALNYYKFEWLNIMQDIKKLYEQYGAIPRDTNLEELGFKLSSNYYVYGYDKMELKILPMAPRGGFLAPFILSISKNGVRKISKGFSNLDSLLDFIVSGGED